MLGDWEERKMKQNIVGKGKCVPGFAGIFDSVCGTNDSRRCMGPWIHL